MMKMAFLLLQIIVFGVVYLIAYTAYKVVGYAITKHDLSLLMYVPVGMVVIIFPILLYYYRQMFSSGNILVAITWMMASASLSAILLYLYIAQIVP